MGSYPSQWDWRGNWVTRSWFQMQQYPYSVNFVYLNRYAGDDSDLFSPAVNTQFTDNTVLWPCAHDEFNSSLCDQRMFWLMTVNLNADGTCCVDGTPPLRSADNWNDNTYDDTFSAYFWAGDQGGEWTRSTFDEWKTRSTDAGCSFDTNSALVSRESYDFEFFWLINEYEANKA